MWDEITTFAGSWHFWWALGVVAGAIALGEFIYRLGYAVGYQRGQVEATLSRCEKTVEELEDKHALQRARTGRSG